MEEVGGAVEGIDDPAVGGILAFQRAALLGEESVGRAGLPQFGDEGLVGAVVGGGDEIARALHGDLEVLDLAEVAGEAAAGLEHGGNHHVEKGRAGHCGVPWAQTGRAGFPTTIREPRQGERYEGEEVVVF